jgi:hypothetical protein
LTHVNYQTDLIFACILQTAVRTNLLYMSDKNVAFGQSCYLLLAAGSIVLPQLLLLCPVFVGVGQKHYNWLNNRPVTN